MDEQTLGDSGEEKHPLNRQKLPNRSDTQGGRRSNTTGPVERERINTVTVEIIMT